MNNKTNESKDGVKAMVQPCFKVYTAKQIQDDKISRAESLVDGLVTPGLNILAAPRKQGKSWMALQLGICVAGTENFLGRETGHGGVLYFALEDTEDRMNRRLNTILDDEDAPADLRFSFSTRYSGSGFDKGLDEFLKSNPGTKLVIIDVLQKIRMDKRSNQTEYSHDYKECGALKEIADKYGISILVVHHCRKTKDGNDPLNEIAGGVGVTGAADTILKISGRKDGADKRNILSVTGRDVPERSFEIAFNPDTCKWKYIGTEEELNVRRDEDAYAASPAIRAVKKLLENQTSWQGTISDLLKQSKGVIDGLDRISVSAMARKINKFDDLLLQDGIVHTRPDPNGGNAGRNHLFVRKDKDTADS